MEDINFQSTFPEFPESMKPLRLALTTGNYHHIKDGVSLTLNRLVSFLESQQIEVQIFAPKVKNPDLDHIGVLHAVHSVPAPGRPEYRIPLSLGKKNRDRLTKFKPDLVHIATPDPVGFQIQKWAIKRNIPVVSSFHTNFISYLPYYKLDWLMEGGHWLLKRFYNRCEQVYVPTPSMSAELKAQGVHANRLRLWQRGVDSELFRPSKRSDAWRTAHSIKPEEIVITFVSRLVLEKNTELYCQVIRELPQELNVKALVVGDGPARERMEELLPEACFTGRLLGEELATAYASSDLFFFPSVTETFGNVTLEAMASGLPCVVAKAAGSSSLVEEGKSGFVVSTADAVEAKEALTQLIVNSQMRKEFGLRSREIALAYTFEKINQKLLSYYAELFPSAGLSAPSQSDSDFESILIPKSGDH